jgi:hypothetical protein
MKTQFEQNGAIYSTYLFNIDNLNFSVMVVKGRFNYVNVTKINHCRSLGKDFESFEAARSHYKNEKIKKALTQIEAGI